MNDFKLHDMSTWSGALVLGFSVAIFASYDVVNWALMRATATTTKLPINTGKHLDTLDRTDYVFITINRLTGVPFVFHCIQWASTSSSMLWHPSELSVSNTLGSLLCLFVFYDFFYCLWHRLLHVRSIYGLIHKHHHRQVVPTRGLYDAMNVHPVEFLVGEYLHLIAMMVIPAHIITYTTFFALLGELHCFCLHCTVPNQAFSMCPSTDDPAMCHLLHPSAKVFSLASITRETTFTCRQSTPCAGTTTITACRSATTGSTR